MTHVRIATRRSPLAVWQAEHVAGRLRDAHPGLEVSLVPMRTFEYEFERVMTDPQQLYGHMARDLYAAGTVLRTKKYRYLRWSYKSLMLGFVFGLAGLALSLLVS